MAEIVRFGVSLDKDLLTEFDRKIAEEGYETRSKAVGDLLKEYVIEKEFASGGTVAGAVTILYDHHNRDLLSSLMDIQHDYHDSVISIQHIHLDHDNCLEILAVRGNSDSIKKLYTSLKIMKGIKHTSINITGTK
ncbi:MAG: nickel-responsive transcriptional regulator NikR [Geovibrio sp.]|jgi:CopG family nickel-responsive transcriptional regulator|uniref:nickel-responsive transcriptional regulator NikR n=1 Tax=Geovibrio ferrireducens TaxID=46201 RepID=UPI0022483618|nr:nickel-responsive transcriptional regulator NikR [Geovibrio ferrireducens]MCD8491419.1 nickel-responsive transcriptional regulator NikR [Geovibrio sp.]MCD8567718.1 nickel-responsive transcriptional regulator NikR [Geovibrio sp.]